MSTKGDKRIWESVLAEQAQAVGKLKELTDLLKQVDRVEFTGGHKWLYWNDDTNLWVVREHAPYAKRGHDLHTGPSLLDALRVLVGEKKE